MKEWMIPSVEELEMLYTKGGNQNGTEGNGKGNKYNGGVTPTPAPTVDPGAGSDTRRL